MTVAQSTMRQMAAAVTSPSGTPSLARDSSDRIAALIQSVMGGGDSAKR